MLVKHVCHLICLDTGILLDAEVVELQEELDQIHIRVSGYPLATVDKPLEDADDEEIAWEMLHGISHIKEKLTKIRIRQIEDSLEFVKGKIREILLAVFDEEMVEGMEMEIRDLGYSYHHTMTEEEAERGYPDLGYCITDFEGFDYSFPINAENFDENEVGEELLKDFRSFICSTCQDNQKENI